jgi:hypothetical protein
VAESEYHRSVDGIERSEVLWNGVSYDIISRYGMVWSGMKWNEIECDGFRSIRFHQREGVLLR